MFRMHHLTKAYGDYRSKYNGKFDMTQHMSLRNEIALKQNKHLDKNRQTGVCVCVWGGGGHLGECVQGLFDVFVMHSNCTACVLASMLRPYLLQDLQAECIPGKGWGHSIYT